MIGQYGGNTAIETLNPTLLTHLLTKRFLTIV